MIGPVGHDDRSARGDHVDVVGRAETCGRARSVGEGGSAAARKRRDDASGRHKPNAMIASVGHNDHAARGDHGNSERVVESCGRARRTVGESSSVAARKRRDDAEGRHEPDAIVVHVGNNSDAARGDNSDSRRAVKACSRACAVGECGAAAPRERHDDAAVRRRHSRAHHERERLRRRSLLRVARRAPLEHGGPRRGRRALDPRGRAPRHAAIAGQRRGRERARHRQVAAASERQRAAGRAGGAGDIRDARGRVDSREGRHALGLRAREVEGRVNWPRGKDR
jgi:hypothetical protein